MSWFFLFCHFFIFVIYLAIFRANNPLTNNKIHFSRKRKFDQRVSWLIYGQALQWKPEQSEQYGAYLLQKAFGNFQNNRCRKIMNNHLILIYFIIYNINNTYSYSVVHLSYYSSNKPKAQIYSIVILLIKKLNR